MTLQRYFLALVFLCCTWVWMMPEASAAEKWVCRYKGTYTNRKAKSKGRFLWKVSWHKVKYGWRMLGEYVDKSGRAFLDGKCVNKFCQFVQFYKSGALRGKKYYWVGVYTDKNAGSRSTINHFKGIWGYSAKELSSGGNWKATAYCDRIR